MFHVKGCIVVFLLLQHVYCVVNTNERTRVDPTPDNSQVLRFPDDPYSVSGTQSFAPDPNPAPTEYEPSYVTKDPTLAGGFQKSSGAQCPSRHSGPLPHPSDCRKFINCFKGRGFIQVCAPGTLFNAASLECDFPAKAVCASNQPEAVDSDALNEIDGEVSLHKPYGELGNEESRRHFMRRREIKTASKSHANYINSGGPQNVGMTEALFPDVKESDGAVSLAEDGTVVFPGDEGARSSKKRQSGKATQRPKCPPGANGIYPDPTNCAKYLSCANGRTFEMDCAPGTLFNPDLSVCDFPYNVDCDKKDLTSGAHNTEQPPPYRGFVARDPGLSVREGFEAQYSPDALDNRSPIFSNRKTGSQNSNDDLLANKEGYDPPVKGYGAQKKPNKNVPLQLSGDNLTRDPQEGPYQQPSYDRSQGSRAHTQPTPGYPHSNPPNYNSIQRQPIKPKPHDTANQYNPQTPYGKNDEPIPYGTRIRQPSQNRVNTQQPNKQYNPETNYGPTNRQSNTPSGQPTTYVQPNQPVSSTPYGQSYDPTTYGSPNQPTPYGSPNQPTPYGSPNQPTPYGSPNQATPYGSPNQPTPYGSPNQPTPYGSPNQPTPYGSPIQSTPYGSPNQATPYGSPIQPTPVYSSHQPATPYGSPNQPTTCGQVNPPTTYDSPNQLPPCGQQSNEPTHFVRPSQSPQPSDLFGNQNFNSLSPYNPNTHSSNGHSEPPPQHHVNQPTELGIPKNDQYQPSGHNPPTHQPSGYSPSYGSPQQPNIQQENPYNSKQPNQGYDKSQTKPNGSKKNNPNYNKHNTKAGPSTPASQYKPSPSVPSQDLLPPFEEATEGDPNDFRILVDDLPQNQTEDDYQQPTQDFDIEASQDPPQGRAYPVYSGNNKRDVKSKGPVSNFIPTYVVPSKKPISRQMVRLRGGSKPSEGFLEMKSSAGTEWGLVCDEPNGWSKNEADVICQQLGYIGGADLTWQGRPSSSQNTTLKKPAIVKVECSGREASILDCKLIKGRTCDVEKDSLWIRCLGNHASQCRPGEVSYNNKCYSLVVPSEEAPANDSVGFSQSEAMKHCQTKGGHLLDISSQKENDFLSEWLTHQDQLPSIMTSGVGVSVMGRPLWIWEGSEEAFVHQNWWPGWDSKTAMSPRPQTMRALCVVLKRFFDCPSKNTKVETTKQEEGVKCDSEYFFWEAEDCGSLSNTHPYVCKRPVDDIGCIKDTGKDYKGNANVTRSGFNCLAWDNPMVLPALEFEVSEHARKAILSGHDHCRNPDGTEALPWCFILTNVGIDKDYCDIPACRTKDSAKIIEARALTDPNDGSCGANLFQCESKECIPKPWVCDGQADCLNGLDEQNCTDSVIKFAHQPAAKLEGHDKEKWMHSTVSNCANKCVETKEFECLSFSFSIKDKTCLLSDHNVGTSGALAVNQPDWDYYEMNAKSVNCEGKFLCQNGKCIHKSEMCNGFNNCGDRSDEMNCPNIELGYEVRLTSGNNMTHFGRVEVKVFGEWGLVCDDKFGMKDADVICRELGFKMGAAETYTYTQTPTINGSHPLTLPILMDEVECTGNETSLKDCAFNGWGIHDCGPEEVAGVICSMPGMKCKTNFWQCQNSQECIPLAFLCDGTKDCDDQSDEDAKVCASVKSTTLPPPKQSVQRIAKKAGGKS